MEEELKEIKELAENNAKAIKDNFAKIQNNSLALDILKDYKKEVDILNRHTKRLYTIILLLIFSIIILGLHHLIGR